MKILEGEIDLRNETRVVQQNKSGQLPDEHARAASALADTQSQLRDMTEEVTQSIRELPNAEEDFAQEVNLLSQVATVMTEAEETLAAHNTGEVAIAAETEAIELLLQAKRQNSKGGGGGGSNPGGSFSKAQSELSALALVGSGLDLQAEVEDTGNQQSTGVAGPEIPEEFKRGLDQYFQKFEINRPN